MKKSIKSILLAFTILMTAAGSMYFLENSKLGKIKPQETAISQDVDSSVKQEVNAFKKIIDKAQKISDAHTENPRYLRDKEKLIRDFETAITTEREAFENAIKELEIENNKLVLLKNQLNESIMRGDSKEIVDTQNRIFEEQARLLADKQLDMNMAYQNLMLAQDRVIEKLIVQP